MNTKTSIAKLKANEKYLSKLDDIKIRVPKGDRAVIKSHAENAGQSLNAYILTAISERMERDKTKPNTP